MKHSIFALGCLALLGLTSCEKGFDLNSELIPQKESAADTGDRVYLSAGLIPHSFMALGVTQNIDRFKDVGSQKIWVHLPEPATQDVEVTLGLTLSPEDLAKAQTVHRTQAKFPFAPEGLLKLSKTTLTIKKGAVRSEEYAELLFDNTELLRNYPDDDDFFAGVKIEKVSGAKVSELFAEGYALITRKVKNFKSPAPNTYANTGVWNKIPWTEVTLSANHQSEGTDPNNVTDTDKATAWSLDSYDKTVADSKPYTDAWYQFNFTSPKKLRGYTIQMYKEALKGQFQYYDLMLSRDGGNTWVTIKDLKCNMRGATRTDPATRRRYTGYRDEFQTWEFDDVLEGINAVRILCYPEKGKVGAHYLAGIQFYQE